uniref:TSA: Wollemia nobilis Ref_Wollemi_Transcript_13837_1100 transcribed RNA sequence n=1 Tax=Wollemia nobilis TaxID=56998 RepID=A0A0C9QQM4_9CONI
MLAVFREVVAKAPEELVNDDGGAANCSRLRKSDRDLIDHFVSSNPQAMCLQLGGDGVMAYTHYRQPLLMPRSLGVVDDVFCVFIGTVENLPSLRREYGLTKNVKEVMIAIEAYKALRDRGPYPADQVLQDFEGHFAFVLYDSTSKRVVATRDSEGKAPLFWGQTADGSLAFSDEEQVLKDGCGISFAPFPEGCFYSTSKGLQSYEHPLHKMKAVPWVDASGQTCGAKFVVDSAMREGIHHVSSAANWSHDF